MEEAKTFYKIINEIWQIAKKYNFEKLSDERYSSMTEDINHLIDVYGVDTKEDALIRKMAVGTINYYLALDEVGNER